MSNNEPKKSWFSCCAAEETKKEVYVDVRQRQPVSYTVVQPVPTQVVQPVRTSVIQPTTVTAQPVNSRLRFTYTNPTNVTTQAVRSSVPVYPPPKQ